MTVAARRQWVLLALLVASISINYIDRSNLSVAAPDLSAELRLTPEHLGLLLGAFFWTYAALQMVAGWLVDRYNVYLIYGVCFLVWSLATALTGFAASFVMLFSLRLVLGGGESIAYPAYSRIIARDFPERHRGLANALIDAGSKVGPALGTLLGGLIIAGFGWRSLFFLLGFGALMWLVPWFALIPRRGGPAALASRGGPGFLDIARRRDAWGTFLALFCVNYAWYFILTWLPFYLVRERQFSTTMMAVWGSLPYWGIAASSVFGGWASDRLIARGAGTSPVRKGFAVSGLLLPALFMLPVPLVANQALSLGLLIIGCLSFGLCSSNLWAITQTLAGPQAAGKWTGMQNCLGNIAGVVAPYLTGVFVERTGHFFAAFAAVCFWLVVGACSYLFIVGPVAPVPWELAKRRGRGASGETASEREQNATSDPSRLR